MVKKSLIRSHRWQESRQIERFSIRKIGFDVSLSVLLLAAVVIFKDVTNPYERGLYCDDQSIRYPFKRSTIPSYALQVFSFGATALTVSKLQNYAVNFC